MRFTMHGARHRVPNQCNPTSSSRRIGLPSVSAFADGRPPDITKGAQPVARAPRSLSKPYVPCLGLVFPPGVAGALSRPRVPCFSLRNSEAIENSGS
jgi:hypothetical protein